MAKKEEKKVPDSKAPHGSRYKLVELHSSNPEDKSVGLRFVDFEKVNDIIVKPRFTLREESLEVKLLRLLISPPSAVDEESHPREDYYVEESHGRDLVRAFAEYKIHNPGEKTHSCSCLANKEKAEG